MKTWKTALGLVMPALLLWVGATQAQVRHFRYHRGNISMSVILNSVTVDGEPIDYGDEVGVFTPGGICAGANVYEEGVDFGLAAWLDDEATDEIDGFDYGEPLSFKIWLHVPDVELNARISRIISGRNEFDENAVIRLELEGSLQNMPPVIELLDGDINFGEVWVDFSETREVRIHNSGVRTLVVDDISVDGSEYFTTDFDADIEVQGRQTATFNVTFQPGEAGEHSATITLHSNDPENENASFQVFGVGRVAQPPNLVLSASEFHFANTRVGRSRVWTLTVTNRGELPGEITDVYFDREDNVFTSNFSEAIEIGSGQSARLVVTFSPAEVAEYEATMTLETNDPDNDGIFQVALSGAGIEEGDPEIALAQNEHWFPNVAVNERAAWRMTILNVGASDLWVYDVSSDQDYFTEDFNADSVRLRPDDHYNVWVYFTPPATGYFYGALTIRSNDPAQEEIVCNLGGFAVDRPSGHFRYYATDASHSLLAVEVTMNGQAMNAGDEVGIFTEAGLCAGGGFVEADGRAGLRAYADDPESDLTDGFLEDESFTFRVWDRESGVEAPAAVEFIEGPEVFTPDGMSRISLAARAVDLPRIELSATVNYFGQVDYDDHQTKTWSFRIYNRGVGDLRVDGVESDLNVFTVSIDRDFPVTLRTNEPLEVTVTFAPDAEEYYMGRLTVTSNDPWDPVVYVDLFGQGVTEVNEPDYSPSADNHFFGVQHILGENDAPYEFILTITNAGGGELILENFGYQGSDVFSARVEDQRVIIRGGNSLDVPFYFAPRAAGNYQGVFSATTNDPEQEQVTFAVWGIAVAAQDHFLHYQTATSHLLNIDDAIIITLQDQETWLVPGDEVAVFTQDGLCAGHVIVTQEMVNNTLIPLRAYGDDPNSPFKTGFDAGEAFTFRFWDWSVRDELDMDQVEFTQGPSTFEVNGQSTVRLVAQAVHSEAQIQVTPRIYNFGAVTVNNQATHTFVVSNIGGRNLTVSGVQSNLGVFTTDFREQIVLEPEESFDLNVTFRPDRAIAFEGAVTITSDDPDENNYVFNPVGMGSNVQGHFVYFRTDRNHSLLIEEIRLGDSPPSVGDEVAVFTPEGLCAGAMTIEDPDSAAGLSAWGDNTATQILVEGFRTNENMQIRYWASGIRREFAMGDEDNPIEVELIQGNLRWRSNGLTILNLRMPAVPVIRPIAPIRIEEGNQVNFRLQVDNAGDLDFEWEALADLPGDAEFQDNGDNTASFTWDVSYETIQGANRPLQQRYDLRFRAYAEAEDLTLTITVVITVVDVNRAPAVVEEYREARFGDDNTFAVNEDAGEVLVANLAELFRELDGDQMNVYYRNVQNVSQRIDYNNQAWPYYVRPAAEWSGQVQITLIADDNLDRDAAGPLRQLRRVGGNRDGVGRSLRSVNGTVPPVQPSRDRTTEFTYTLIVNPVNDAPVVRQPTENPEYRIQATEGQETRVNLRADDADNAAAELRWSVADRDGLPDAEEWSLTDNQDGSAVFVWTPNYNTARQEPYRPVLRVSDPGGAADDIALVISVSDVNQRPQVNPNAPNAFTILEDSPRQNNQLADLDTVIYDGDAEDANLTWTIAPNPLQLSLQIDAETHILSAQPIPDFNTAPPRGALRVVVQGADRRNESASWEFMVNITDVNDLPRPFQLVSPPDRDTLRFDTSGALTFDLAWTEAVQANYESDSVRYNLFITERDLRDTLWVRGLVQFSFQQLDIRRVIDSLDLRLDRHYNLLWGVYAVDRANQPMPATNNPFRLYLEVLNVNDLADLGVPKNYALSPNFPNPFNSQTTVRFALPKPEEVIVSVWDMHGRRVATLAEGRLQAGYYEAVWDASSQTSGVYLIRLQTPTYRAMQKAILLR